MELQLKGCFPELLWFVRSKEKNRFFFSPEQARDKMTFSLCIDSPDHLTKVISATRSMQLYQMANKPKVYQNPEFSILPENKSLGP